MVVLVDHVDVAGDFFGQEGRCEEDCHDDDGKRGHKAGAPAGVQLVEGDESLVLFVHVDHVDLLVDGGLSGEFGGDFSHGFAVPDAAVDAHELFAVFVDGPHGGEAAVA